VHEEGFGVVLKVLWPELEAGETRRAVTAA